MNTIYVMHCRVCGVHFLYFFFFLKDGCFLRFRYNQTDIVYCLLIFFHILLLQREYTERGPRFLQSSHFFLQPCSTSDMAFLISLWKRQCHEIFCLSGILRGLGETDSWKNLKSKISRNCPFIFSNLRHVCLCKLTVGWSQLQRRGIRVGFFDGILVMALMEVDGDLLKLFKLGIYDYILFMRKKRSKKCSAKIFLWIYVLKNYQNLRLSLHTTVFRFV